MRAPGADVSYAYAVGRVRALESALLSDAQMGRLADSTDAASAMEILREHRRYAEAGFRLESVDSVDEACRNVIDAMCREVRELSLHPEITEIWLARFDLDGIKLGLRKYALEGSGEAEESPETEWPPALADLAEHVTLGASETRDPLVIDAMVDTGYLEQLYRAADRVSCSFLTEYARLATDIYNMRAFLRARAFSLPVERRMRLFGRKGTVSADDFAGAFQDDADVPAMLGRSPYGAVSLGLTLRGDPASLESLDLLCDNTLTGFMQQTKRFVFGIEPLLGYAHGVELEVGNIRRVLVGKMLGVEGPQIRERLRQSYV